MKRKALYSRATRPRARPPQGGASEQFDPTDLFVEQTPLTAGALKAVKRFVVRHDRGMTVLGTILIVIALFGFYIVLNPQPRPYTQWDIENAVKYALENTPPAPAESAVAASTIAPSVVRVDGYLSPEHAAELANLEKEAQKKKGSSPHQVPAKPRTETKEADDGEPHPDSTGTGVVIDERGNIMTNLHVISSTDRWVVTFADGSKSDATLVTMQPENDLAVIRAKKTPNEIKPAALASTRDLHPGDMVTAVGFPFGIGPSVSSGVVAGLKREFYDAESKKGKLTNLIQFDAAVNPGNSGGPLVNRDGEVVGIVTAIYNPTGQHVFAGMGFAVPIENAAKAMGENPL
jgi:S1-C subfamily serine protease